MKKINPTQSENITIDLRRGVNRRDFLRLSALLGAGIASGLGLSACAPAATPPSAAPSGAAPAPAKPSGPSGTLTIAQGVDIESIDPYITTSGASKGIMWTIFDRLVYRDINLKVQPGLALSWKNVDDNTWEFKLREGVKFHNGEAFNAEAVKYSFARFVDPNIKNGYATLFKPVKEVEVVNDSTVRVKTSEPFAELVEVLASYCEILPPKAAADKDAFYKNPVGTGPYKFVSWTANDKFVVEAAGPHWSGEPRMKQVVFRPIPDGTTRITELRSGGVDIITNVSPLLLGNLQNQPGIALERATGSGSIILIPNVTNNPMFAKKEVRQALQYAIDKEAIIKAVLQGAAVPLTSPFPKGVAGGFVDDLKMYPYDPDKAKSLLKQAGAENLKVAFKSPNGRYLQDKAVAEAIVGQLDKVGIKAELETIEWSQYVQGIIGRKYELFLLSQGGVQVGPAATTNWSSKIKGIAWQGYTNPEADDLMDKAAKTVDGAQRQATYEKLMRLVWDESPWIFLYHQQDIYGLRDRVKNFKATSEGSLRLEKTEVV